MMYQGGEQVGAWDQYSNSPRPHAAVGAEAPERIHAAVVPALLSAQCPGTVHSMRNPRLALLALFTGGDGYRVEMDKCLTSYAPSHRHLVRLYCADACELE